jgi:hypothetical protein
VENCTSKTTALRELFFLYAGIRLALFYRKQLRQQVFCGLVFPVFFGFIHHGSPQFTVQPVVQTDLVSTP